MKIVPRLKVLRFAMMTASYVVALTTIVEAIAINSQIPVSNQYCAIATFYFGFFGSLFVTNIIKVVINSVYAESILNKEKSLFRFFLSSDAVTVMRDIKNVRNAEKQLSFKPSE